MAEPHREGYPLAEVETDLPIIESREQLAAYLESGSKPKCDWRIGTEHEKFGFHRADFSPVAYDGDKGIRALLDGLAQRFGWSPIIEEGRIIGLNAPEAVGGGISLEPGGQLELSGAPLENLHQTCDCTRCGRSPRGSILVFSALDFRPNGGARTCPRCPRAVTASCHVTCQKLAAGALI